MSNISPLGMPAARAFSLRASKNNPLFVVTQRSLEEVYYNGNLKVSGVEWDNYGYFEDARVFVFTVKEMKELLKRAALVMSQRYGSSRANIEWVTLATEPKLPAKISPLLVEDAFLSYPFEIKNGDFNGESRDDFSYLVGRILGPIVQKKILLGVPHCHQHDYNNRGGFQVYVWSTPDNSTPLESPTPSHIWGYRVYARDTSFGPFTIRKNAGVLISDGDYAVAELHENALYIHYDLVHKGSEDAFHIMARILEAAAAYLLKPKLFATELAKANAPYLEKQRTAFTDLVKGAIPNRTMRNKSDLERALTKARELRKKFLDAERTVFGLQKALLDPADVERTFRAEFAKLQEGRVGMVERVELETTRHLPRLHIFTSEIMAENPHSGLTHRIGRFRIVINLEVSSDDDDLIRMFNLDRKSDEGCHHPHVDEEGVPCLGNLSEELPEYIAHFEIEAAVTLAIAFLQTMSPGDWFTGPEEFPVVKTHNARKGE